MTGSDPRELLSALLDREPVDADALAACLEERESRALLVDFVRVRAILHADVGDPGGARPLVSQRAWLSRPLLQLAAAVLLVALGVAAGRHVGVQDPDAPPEPTRVVKLEPAGFANGGGR